MLVLRNNNFCIVRIYHNINILLLEWILCIPPALDNASCIEYVIIKSMLAVIIINFAKITYIFFSVRPLWLIESAMDKRFFFD